MRAVAWVAAILWMTVWWHSGVTHAEPATCSGVWVVVGDDISCAREHATGEQALLSAGHSATKKDMMVCQIDGRPERCNIAFDAYWSYWQAVRQPDGSYGPWVYASVGAATRQPSAGDAEGWAFGPGEPPLVTPPTDSYRPGEVGPKPTPVSESSPTPTIATLATLVVGSTALTLAHRRRSLR